MKESSLPNRISTIVEIVAISDGSFSIKRSTQTPLREKPGYLGQTRGCSSTIVEIILREYMTRIR